MYNLNSFELIILKNRLVKYGKLYIIVVRDIYIIILYFMYMQYT